jgi:hypothetical protein
MGLTRMALLSRNSDDQGKKAGPDVRIMGLTPDTALGAKQKGNQYENCPF